MNTLGAWAVVGLPAESVTGMIKRLTDVLLSAIILLLMSPIALVISLCIYARMGRPVVFRQTRVGRNRRLFKVYKFRTMTNACSSTGRLLPDAQRTTRLGTLLRETSLDELPQLLNVLKGEMSLIGPRPFLQQYVEQCTPQQDRRHRVRPGITGWAQVHGRNRLSYEDRFRLDVWYVDNQSFLLDMRILLLTAAVILRRQDVYPIDAP